jgi:type II secretory pathway component PulC
MTSLVLAYTTWAFASAQQPATPLQPTTLPLRLTGLVVDVARPALNACVISCTVAGERGGVLRVGDRACGVAEIQEVRPDFVVIENLVTRRRELLSFSAPSAATAAAPERPAAAASARPTSQDVVVDLPKAAIEGYLANLPDLLSSALATPRYRDVGAQRVVDGYELSQVRAGGAAEQLGLKDGDVITEINGQALDGLPTVMRLFGEAQTMPRATLVVLRAGLRLTFVVNTGKEPR